MVSTNQQCPAAEGPISSCYFLLGTRRQPLGSALANRAAIGQLFTVTAACGKS